MKVLFIAPLPPPINGHSLMSQHVYDGLVRDHEVRVVDLRKKRLKQGVDSLSRVGEIGALLAQVALKRFGAERVYITIAESLAGNLKDVLIYVLCLGILRRVYVHLHGGSLKRLLFDRHPVAFALNRFFLRRAGGVILSGESHREIFEGYVDPRRITIVPNCAGDAIFSDEGRIRAKFAGAGPIELLFVSNMLPEKGYVLLMDAFESLSADERARFRLRFAGRFDLDEERVAFEARVPRVPEVEYLGIVEETRKIALFGAAHVLCLPTMFFEGQPIAILEGYAAGCVVLTTGQKGILDVFTGGENGYQVEAGSAGAIADALRAILRDRETLLDVALLNHRQATERYRSVAYTAGVLRAMGI